MKLVVLVAVTLFSGTAVQAQTIYVWNSTGSPDPLVGYDGTIVKISGGQETTLANTGSNFNGPVGLAVDSNGFLYSGNPSNSTVTQYAAGGVSTSVGGFDSISGLTFSNGQLFGTSPNYNEIVGEPISVKARLAPPS